MKSLVLIFAALTAGLAREASAGVVVDFDGIYGLSSIKTTETYSSTDMYSGLFIGATVSKKPYYTVGFRGNYVSQSIAGGTANKAAVSVMEWGPQFGMIFGRTAAWHLDASYHIYASGSVTEGGTSLGTFTGSGYQVSIAYAGSITSSLFFGGKLLYRGLAIKKLVDASSTSSTVSYAASQMIPCIFISWRP